MDIELKSSLPTSKDEKGWKPGQIISISFMGNKCTEKTEWWFKNCVALLEAHGNDTVEKVTEEIVNQLKQKIKNSPYKKAPYFSDSEEENYQRVKKKKIFFSFFFFFLIFFLLKI